MENNSKKESLRKLLLEKRDNTSFDLLKIASKQIQKKINKIKAFRDAQKIGYYYPIGSEILTQDFIQEALSKGKQAYLPKITKDEMEFRQIKDFSDLEIGKFDIMEPKDSCQVDNTLDIIIVPTIGVSPKGVRLGYGHGYYDKFLSKNKIETVSITLEKQIVKNIPQSKHDVLVDWIVTEDRTIQTSKIR